MSAPVHPDEFARVGALRRYEILDTPREAEFDDVVDIARRVCGIPVAVINLIDSHRQWFKAEVGLDTSETALENSICAHVYLAGDFIEIPDTLEDSRLCRNPLCIAEPGFRFYAGATLRTGDGLPIGSLCVLDYAPRTLDALQRDTLRLLAAQVMRQLDMRAALIREALLRREIDHRVKNSLHTVGAFVSLQRRDATDAAAQKTLRAVERQIAAVAALHQLISGVDDGRIALNDYLDLLTRHLGAIAPPGIVVSGSFAPFAGTAMTATVLGTIVNELVANAFKHSFAEGGAGRITLAGTAGDAGDYKIICSDDGGKPGAGVAVSSGTGLGVRIMAAAIRQLSGTMTGGALPGGYRSVVHFPLPH
jgi:two-component sensor histidine kinase